MAYPDLSFLIPSQAQRWYDVLKDFQSGVTGLLGFFGVMVTLWWNARLAQIARKAVLEAERATVRAALLEEMRYEQKRYGRMAAAFDTSCRQEVVFPRRTLAVIYPVLVGKIGLLTPAETQALVEAHSSIVAAHYAAADWCSPRANNDTLMAAKPNQYTKLQETFSRPLPAIAAAIKELDDATPKSQPGRGL